MRKLKKYAGWAVKTVLTALAFRINPAFGIFAGVALFLGIETFAAS